MYFARECKEITLGTICSTRLVGGALVDGEVVDGGHVWFPTYVEVRNLLRRSRFNDIRFFHYYDESGKPVTRPIDYSIGHVMRTPDHDQRVQDPYRPLSIVVDCVKGEAA